MTDERVLNKIFAEYENLRTAAAAERKKRRSEVYSRYPKIEEIDKEMFRRGAENMKRIWENPEKNEEYNKDLKENLARLNAEKNKIIYENNIDPQYDEYKYKCPLCSDTGYTPDGKKCRCFINKLINEAYSMSNMENLVREQNFNTFSFGYYSKEKNSDGVSPYENIKKIYNGCKNFCKNFDSENKSILFYGQTGLGKTFLSSAIAKDIMDEGKTVIYVRATKLFSTYEDYRFGRNKDRTFIDNIYNCDLLIIDDLGTEFNSSNNMSFLFDIINERIAAEKKLIINTNFNLNELRKMYSMRLVSRFYEHFNIYHFIGEDIRLQKLKNS